LLESKHTAWSGVRGGRIISGTGKDACFQQSLGSLNRREAVGMVMEQILIEQEVDAQRALSSPPALNRSQLIDGILAKSPWVDPGFLMSFDDESLKHYLDHLGCAEEPRITAGRWVRGSGKPVAWWRDNLD